MTRGRAIGAAFTYAAFFGLLSGVLEWAVRSLLPWAPPWRIRLGAYLLWMPAVANLILFSAVALVLAAVLWWKPRLATPRSLTFVFVGLATINVLALVTPPLHMVAALLLAAGVAVGAARLAGRYSDRVDRLAGFGAVSLATAVGAVAISVEVNRALAARPDTDRPAVSQQTPNILLLVLDNVRSLNLTPYGYFRDTSPTLQRLAERGVLFERAYSTSSWSLPSHASLMTGRWVHELDADWVVPLDDRYPTLAEALSQHGYRTGGFVSNGAYTQRESGLSRGFTYYEDYPLSIRQVLLSSKLGARATSFWQNHIGPLQGPFSNIYHRRSAAGLHDRLLRWL
ncbi:MAG: sulfatase-like hydrolase/transferase, partial [Longimicrobiales bacterium]